MVKGITFDKQTLTPENHAHQTNYFYQGKMGVTKGCTITEDANGDLVVADGYFIIYGRLIQNLGNTIVDVSSVASGTLYSTLLFEVDLTKTNTVDVFNQGSFKIISDASDYPVLTQNNLDDGGTLYQMEFARFENTVAGIVGLTDTRTILDLSRYLTTDITKFQTATGTGNEITLSNLNMSNGSTATFIAIANNNGNATTINNKPLYKPNTVNAPNIISGKAYTVWYDFAGDCFFIKASASGNVTADKVLAPYSFSNYDDADILGTMPNRGAVAITPSTVQQTIQSGYHNGQGYVTGDPNLVAENILSGKSIFGVAGSLVLGKKFASGTAATITFANCTTRNYVEVEASTSSFCIINITDLPFNPSIIEVSFMIGEYTYHATIRKGTWICMVDCVDTTGTYGLGYSGYRGDPGSYILMSANSAFVITRQQNTANIQNVSWKAWE